MQKYIIFVTASVYIGEKSPLVPIMSQSTLRGEIFSVNQVVKIDDFKVTK